MAFSHHELLVHRVNNLIETVSINVVHLERDIVRQMVLPAIRFTDLPEHLAFKIHSGEATELAVSVLGPMVHYLSDQNIGLTIPIQIPESQVPADTKAGG
jgi:hypothetical protein